MPMLSYLPTTESRDLPFASPLPRLREAKDSTPEASAPIKPRRPRTSNVVPSCWAFHLIRTAHVTCWRCDASPAHRRALSNRFFVAGVF